MSNNTVINSSGSITVQVRFTHGQQQPQPGGQASLYFHYEDGGGIPALNNQAGTRTTDADGWAIFQIYFSGLPTGTPISIDATVHYSGSDYVQKDAASFSVVNVTPSVTPSPQGNGG